MESTFVFLLLSFVVIGAIFCPIRLISLVQILIGRPIQYLLLTRYHEGITMTLQIGTVIGNKKPSAKLKQMLLYFKSNTVNGLIPLKKYKRSPRKKVLAKVKSNYYLDDY